MTTTTSVFTSFDETMENQQEQPEDEANWLHPNHFLATGLRIAGFRQKRLAMRTQLRRFRAMYGCDPKVVRVVWYDLVKVLPENTTIDHLFWGLFFLKRYPTEEDMAGRLQKDPVTVRKWVWSIIFGLQELKADKICFPEDGFELVFVVTVDGTDCRIQEPRPFSKTWFSQKYKGPAVKYEVAIDVLSGRCVWVNGPFRGSKNDVTIYREGLKHLIPPGKFVIADKAYRGDETASPPNHLDEEDIAELKKRNRARQETFNSRLKSFKVLDDKFRHKPVMEKHKACFEAVAVLVQYGIDCGFPLFVI